MKMIEKPLELTFDAADDDVNEFLPNKSLESKTTNENSLSLSTTEKQNLWLATLNLYIHDKEIILNDDWLNDRHMHAVHKSLQKQFELINGFQSTLLAPNIMKIREYV